MILFEWMQHKMIFIDLRENVNLQKKVKVTDLTLKNEKTQLNTFLLQKCIIIFHFGLIIYVETNLFNSNYCNFILKFQKIVR